MATSLTRKGLICASDKVILAARPAMELVRQFVLDASPKPGDKGATVRIPVMAATAKDFNETSQNYVTSTNSIKYADVVLSGDKISAYTLNDLDALEDDLAPVWGQLAPTAGRAIGKAFVEAVMSVLTYDKADAQKTVATATFADFVKIRAAVSGAGYDPADTVLLLEPNAYNTLVSLLPASVVGEGGVVNSALIGARLGFKAVLEAPHASKTSGAKPSSGNAPEKGVGFAVPANALIVANRYKAPILGAVGNLVEAGQSTDEETGLVIGTRVVVDQAAGVAAWSAEALFGVALAKQNGNGAPGFIQLVTA